MLGCLCPCLLPSRTPLRHSPPLAQPSSGMDVDAAACAPAAEGSAPPRVLPEVEVLCALVTILLLLDGGHAVGAHAVCSWTVDRVVSLKRRSLDSLGAKVFFYYSLSAEKAGLAASARPKLLALHRTSVLRQDEAAQEVLVNCLLRNYLHFNQVEAAEQLRAKLVWPERHSHAQLVRYLFYLGRIKAVQLEYSEAKECLSQAERKAPPQAIAFRLALTKWLTVTRLLLGEIPERRTLRDPQLAPNLAPYFQLTNAVRIGDLSAFTAVSETHAALFAADKVSHLIVRLRRTVIRTGLRRINAAYSRISLADVAVKLGLANAEDAQFVVAKAIRDGAVDATLDACTGVMTCTPVVEAYTTGEPAAAFHARVTFCLDLHNEAVQAMRFPGDAHQGGAAGAEQRKERAAMEAELAAALEEEESEF